MHSARSDQNDLSHDIDPASGASFFVVQAISALAVVCIAWLGLTGCGDARNLGKHLHSSFTGLHRQITLYSANGTVIKDWVTTAKVEDNGGTCMFLDANGKSVTVSGTFIVQEK